MPYPKCSNAFPWRQINRHLCFADGNLLMTPSKTLKPPLGEPFAHKGKIMSLQKSSPPKNLEKHTRDFRATLKQGQFTNFPLPRHGISRKRGLLKVKHSNSFKKVNKLNRFSLTYCLLFLLNISFLMCFNIPSQFIFYFTRACLRPNESTGYPLLRLSRFSSPSRLFRLSRLRSWISTRELYPH